MIGSALLILLAVSPPPSAGATTAPPAPPPAVDEFLYTGGALVCITAQPDGDGYQRCLHLGETRLGDDYAAIVKQHGSPEADQPVEGGAIAHVFVLDRRPGFTAYIAVSERGGRVTAIQLTGSGASRAANLAFAGIHLGDPSARLRERLGPPSAVRPDDGYELWSWAPFPISMEVTGGRVTSIKIWSP